MVWCKQDKIPEKNTKKSNFQVEKGMIVAKQRKRVNQIQKKKKYERFCTKIAGKQLLAKMEINEHCGTCR